MKTEYTAGQRVWVEGSEGIPKRAGTIIRRHDVNGEPGYIVLLEDNVRDLVHEELLSPARGVNPHLHPIEVIRKKSPPPSFKPSELPPLSQEYLRRNEQRSRAIREQVQLFHEQLPLLLETHAGECVLFADGAPRAFFYTLSDAAKEGVQRYGNDYAFIAVPVAPPRSMEYMKIESRSNKFRVVIYDECND